MPGYISEYDHYGTSPEFIELAIPAGTDVSSYSVVIYGSDGLLDHTINLSDLTVQNTIHGWDVYLIETGTPGFSGIDSGDSTALIDDSGTVLQFVTHSSAVTAVDGPAAGETSTYIGNASSPTSSLQSDDGGASYYVQTTTNPGVIPCFAPGSLIETPGGPMPVERLKPGDIVTTLDNGPKPILWVRQSTVALGGAASVETPILIGAGALGRNRPARDLVVSPHHRLLVGGSGQLIHRFANEVFVAAKALTTLPGVRSMQGKRSATWVHFALQSHEIVAANGAMTESLLLGPQVLGRLHQIERHWLSTLTNRNTGPGLTLNGPTARPCLTVSQARAILARDDPVAPFCAARRTRGLAAAVCENIV